LAASDSAASYFERLLALAQRLASHDIVVTRIHGDWRAFGSWEIWTESGPPADAYAKTAHKGSLFPVPAPEVLRLSWDGREGLLSVSTASPPRHESPTHWTRGETLEFRGLDDALSGAEDLAIRRWNGEA